MLAKIKFWQYFSVGEYVGQRDVYGLLVGLKIGTTTTKSNLVLF